MREAGLVHPRRRPAGAARVRRAVARLEAQEGGVSEGDIPGEAVADGVGGDRPPLEGKCGRAAGVEGDRPAAGGG
jgi:hypothetical protein